MRGVTLEEISAATKIGVRFLKSIENEEFSRLPGGIFNRSFVRAYARYLGLDEDPLLEEYQLAAKAKGEADLAQFSPPKTYSRRERRSHSTLWTGMIAVVLLASGYALWRHSRRIVQAPPPATQQVAPLKNSPGRQTATTPSASPAPSASTSAAASPEGVLNTEPKTKESQPAVRGVLAATSAVAPVAPKLPPVTDGDGRLVLQVATTERSWVAIDADAKTVMQGIMNPNEVKTFKADGSFDVLTGNAQGVILTLNGRTLKPLGREGEVKQEHLSWSTLKEQTSH